MRIRNRERNLLLAFVTFTLLITACSTDNSKEEAKKLLDQQKALQENQSEELDDILDEIVSAEDSLLQAQNELIAQEETLKNRIDELELEKVEFEANQETEKLEDLRATRDSLTQSRTTVRKNAKEVSSELARNKKKQDSLQSTGRAINDLSDQLDEKVQTGIDQIDKRIGEIDREKDALEAKISLNERRSSVALRKVGILEQERDMYSEEKNTLIRNAADDKTIAGIDKEISELEDEISEEQYKSKMALERNISLDRRIADIITTKSALKDQVANKYSEGQILQTFMDSEKKRVIRNILDLTEDQKSILGEQSTLAQRRAKIAKQLERLDSLIATSKGDQLALLEEQKALLEQEESDLNAQSQSIDDADASSKSAKTGDTELDSLSEELDKLKQMYAKQSSEIAKQRMELANKQKEKSERKSKALKTASASLGIILGLGVLFVFILIMVGRARRRKRQSMK